MTANADMTPDDGERRHLPECSKSIIPDFYNERWVCICAPLRACEERVLNSAVQRVIELPGLLDAGFTYSGLLHRTVVIDAIRGES